MHSKSEYGSPCLTVVPLTRLALAEACGVAYPMDLLFGFRVSSCGLKPVSSDLRLVHAGVSRCRVIAIALCEQF
jgi:hypothetical protein